MSLLFPNNNIETQEGQQQQGDASTDIGDISFNSKQTDHEFRRLSALQESDIRLNAITCGLHRVWNQLTLMGADLRRLLIRIDEYCWQSEDIRSVISTLKALAIFDKIPPTDLHEFSILTKLGTATLRDAVQNTDHLLTNLSKRKRH